MGDCLNSESSENTTGAFSDFIMVSRTSMGQLLKAFTIFGYNMEPYASQPTTV